MNKQFLEAARDTAQGEICVTPSLLLQACTEHLKGVNHGE